MVITGVPDAVTIRVSEGYAYYAAASGDLCHRRGPIRSERRPPRWFAWAFAASAPASPAWSPPPSKSGASRSRHTPSGPHGHPFDRQIPLEDTCEGAPDATGECHFAVVDEGPGLSGSSFTSVVRALHEMRVDHRRIALFPSWTPILTMLRSVEARQVWSLCRWYTASTEDAGFGLDQIAGGDSCLDFSAGSWRHHVLGANKREWPAVQPQHEVPKALIGDRGSIGAVCRPGRSGGETARADRLAVLDLAHRLVHSNAVISRSPSSAARHAAQRHSRPRGSNRGPSRLRGSRVSREPVARRSKSWKR